MAFRPDSENSGSRLHGIIMLTVLVIPAVMIDLVFGRSLTELLGNSGLAHCVCLAVGPSHSLQGPWERNSSPPSCMRQHLPVKPSLLHFHITSFSAIYYLGKIFQPQRSYSCLSLITVIYKSIFHCCILLSETKKNTISAGVPLFSLSNDRLTNMALNPLHVLF